MVTETAATDGEVESGVGAGSDARAGAGLNAGAASACFGDSAKNDNGVDLEGEGLDAGDGVAFRSNASRNLATAESGDCTIVGALGDVREGASKSV